MQNPVQLFLAAVLSVAVLGCGPSSRPHGVSLAGKVTLDGKDLKHGSLILSPLEGTKGPAAAGKITDGVFKIEASQGPYPGEYRVEVIATPPDTWPGRPVGTATMEERRAFRDVAPTFTGSTSTLRAKITLESDKQPLDFHVKSTPVGR